MAKGKIPKELLEKIKDAVNLIEVVGEHVVLKKSGSNYSGLCPFHSERSPSFSVSEQKQLYHCFGCKKSGDLLSFVQEIHGLSFPEAVEELAERAKVALPKDWGDEGGDEDPETRRRRAAAREKLAVAHKLNRFAAAFYHQSLPGSAHIAQYFRNRGVEGDLARNFYVGAAPASWDALSAHLVSKKAPLPLAVELGLIRPSTRQNAGGPGYFDLFRNRAMFPIVDMRGKVAGFGGRALPLPEGAPDVGGESPKYLNSPDSLLFQKSKLAFGLYQAQKHVREKDEVVVVEGYFDVLALHGAGFQNAVATCGTALTPEHLALFRRLGTRITILFDGDRAGISATERAMELGLDHGFVLYGAALPAGLDPDELLFDQKNGKLIPEGTERMKQILADARPILDTRMEQAMHEALAGPEARTQALKQMAGWLNRFRDPVGREVRLQAIEKQLGVSPQLLEQAMKSVAGTSPRGAAPAQVAKPATNPAGRPLGVVQTGGRASGGPSGATRSRPAKFAAGEKMLLAGLTQSRFSSLFAQAAANLPPKMTLSDLFEYPPVRSFVDPLLANPGELGNFQKSPQNYLGEETDSQVRSIVTEALLDPEGRLAEAEIHRAVDQCVAKCWARFSQQIKLALADAEARKDAGLQAVLMKEYLDVQRKMKEFSTLYDEA